MPIIDKLRFEAGLVRRRIGSSARAQDGSLCQWGIVGTGYMGEQYSRYLDQTEGMNIRAVHSRSASKGRAFSRRHSAVASYDDLARMLKDEVGKLDVVYVATPASTHFPIVKQCLDAGFNTLCEKPLCESVDEAKELFSLADSRGVQLFEGMWSACLPTYAQAKEWLGEGRVGNVRRVEASILKPRQGSEQSCLFDFGAYALTFAATFLNGRPLRVSGTVRRDESGADRAWDIKIEDATGAVAMLRLSTLAAGDSSAKIVGEAGAIQIPTQFNRSNVVELLGPSGCIVETRSFGYRYSGFEYEIADVAAAVRDGAKTALDRRITLKAVALLGVLSSVGEGDFSVEVPC